MPIPHLSVHHLSAPTKAELTAQIEPITAAAVKAGHGWRVQVLHPSAGAYTAIVTVEEDE